MKKVLSSLLVMVLMLSVLAGLDLSAYAVCLHENTRIINQSDATYTAEGYTGDTYCDDCDTVIESGTVIPMLVAPQWTETESGWVLLDENGNKLYGWQELDGVWYYLDLSTGVRQEGFKDIDGNTYYFEPESGARVDDNWKVFDNASYHFDADGVMQTGWLDVGTKRYYLGDDGAAVSGMKEIDGEIYYFNKYAMQSDGWQFVNGNSYYASKSGALYKDRFISVKGVYYYMDETGAAVSGFRNINGKTYYFNKYAMQKGFRTVDGKTYYFDTDGSAASGWKNINGKAYYFNKYAMQKGWRTIDGKRYYLKNDGSAASGFYKIGNYTFYFNKYAMQSNGWIKVNGKSYYLNEYGVMLTGWISVKGVRYYLGSDGAAVSGWKKINGDYYYFNKYAMQTGWRTISGDRYYFKSNGVMATGWTKINGNYYYFDSTGRYHTGFYNVYEYYSSDYVNNYNRTQNLIIASEYIDGTILEPGEIFDFNEVVGPRTSSRGYRPAPVFTGSTGHADEIGGGICQVSSTIFNAALYANFEIVERHQHSQRVYYVPFGRDAAMYQTVNNFRFRNTSGHTIKIGMTVEGGTITCTFYTEEYAKPPSVSLDVSQSGNTFTLRRYVNGSCNYTTTSRY